MTTEALRAALNRAFQLGQTYWQQADSESYKENAKSDATLDAFRALVSKTCAALAQPSIEQPAAEIERLRADAERYRFIRDADRSDCITPEIGMYAMESLDKLVDDAMKDEARNTADAAMKGTT